MSSSSSACRRMRSSSFSSPRTSPPSIHCCAQADTSLSAGASAGASTGASGCGGRAGVMSTCTPSLRSRKRTFWRSTSASLTARPRGPRASSPRRALPGPAASGARRDRRSQSLSPRTLELAQQLAEVAAVDPVLRPRRYVALVRRLDGLLDRRLSATRRQRQPQLGELALELVQAALEIVELRVVRRHTSLLSARRLVSSLMSVLVASITPIPPRASCSAPVTPR